MVKGEREAGKETILLLSRSLIGCHCLSDNDDKLRMWPEQRHMGLSPHWASQRKRVAQPAGALGCDSRLLAGPVVLFSK